MNETATATALDEKTCEVEGCDLPSERSGLCAGHRKQLQRMLKPIRPKSRKQRLALALEHLDSSLQRLVDAKQKVMRHLEHLGERAAECDSEDDREFRLRQREYRAAVDAYARVKHRRR